ncbi:hypothetical protein [Methylobacterium fujisawaense]|uniref:hypothetical protein n=1 Tax=Methylobacterium fujisawaense TaxID=107400 RepID=UPI00313ACC6A
MSNGPSQKIDLALLKILEERRGRLPPSGGEPPDDMKDRIEKLEAGHAAILAKLETIASSISDGRLENEKRFSGFDKSLTKIEERLEHTATAASMAAGHGELSEKIGRVDGRTSSIPTTWQTVAIIAALLVGIAGVSFTVSKINEGPRQASSSAPPTSSPAPSSPGRAP